MLSRERRGPAVSAPLFNKVAPDRAHLETFSSAERGGELNSGTALCICGRNQESQHKADSFEEDAYIRSTHLDRVDPELVNGRICFCRARKVVAHVGNE